MKPALIFAQVLSAISICWAQSPNPQARVGAEYYVASYAHHYKVPVALVRAIVERESNWEPCVVSPKGAVGLMQLMPVTAQAAGSKRPLQSRTEHFRGRAIPRVVDATVSRRSEACSCRLLCRRRRNRQTRPSPIEIPM